MGTRTCELLYDEMAKSGNNQHKNTNKVHFETYFCISVGVKCWAIAVMSNYSSIWVLVCHIEVQVCRIKVDIYFYGEKVTDPEIIWDATPEGDGLGALTISVTPAWASLTLETSVGHETWEVWKNKSKINIIHNAKVSALSLSVYFCSEWHLLLIVASLGKIQWTVYSTFNLKVIINHGLKYQ